MGNVELVIVVCLAVLVVDLLTLALLSGARRARVAAEAAATAREREAAKYDVLRRRGVCVCRRLSPAMVVTVRRFWPNAPDSDITD